MEIIKNLEMISENGKDIRRLWDVLLFYNSLLEFMMPYKIDLRQYHFCIELSSLILVLHHIHYLKIIYINYNILCILY